MSVGADRSEEPAKAGPREGIRRVTRPATDSIADGVRSRTTYAVSLEMFEGPLDLLLHLVRRHELDILDIPIAFVTEKYIEYISFARSLDIEVAGEYLLMAATLAFLKSRELLPSIVGEDEESEDEEDGVDPREELIRRLIEYERFREAGDELGSRPLFGRDVFPRGGDPDVILPEPGLAPVTLFRLAEAYNRVLDRAKIHADHEVVIEAVTVRQRMRQLGLMLSREPKVSFEGLFLSRTWSSEKELRQMLVVTLMSVLEMCKIGVLGVHQAHGSESLELERVVDVAAMTEAISVFREEGVEDELDDLIGAPLEAIAEEIDATEPEVEIEVDPAEPTPIEVEVDVGELEVEVEVPAGVEIEAASVEVDAALVEAADELEVEVEVEVEASEDEPPAIAVEMFEVEPPVDVEVDVESPVDVDVEELAADPPEPDPEPLADEPAPRSDENPAPDEGETE